MASTLPSLIRLGTEAWPLRELAATSGIETAALQRAQRGDLSGWDVGMVVRLARLVGADPAAALSGEPLPVPKLLAFLREASKGVHPRDTIALRRALSRASAVRAAGLRTAHTYAPSRAPSRNAYAAGYAAAQRVRRDVGCPTEPLRDLRGVIEGQLGVLVVAMELESPDLEALAVADDKGAAIVLNVRLPRRPEIWRRSVAHELCHVLFDPKDQEVMVDALETGAEERHSPDAQRESREQRARAFAAELLVPLRALRAMYASPVLGVDQARARVVEVSTRFGAPWELAVHHLVNHALIDDDDGDRLLLDRRPVDTALGLGRPAALQWARDRVEDGDLSEGRARDLFGDDWTHGDRLSA